MNTSKTPASDPPILLPFIVSSDINQVDRATRRLIRSHVMRGKNAKRTKKSPPADHKSAPTPTSSPASSSSETDRLKKGYVSPPPERIGARLYFIGFPEDVEPQLFLDMEQVSSVALKLLFPLMAEVGFTHDAIPWLHPGARDAVALYIGAFATQTFIDRVLRQQPETKVNPIATRHLQKGLQLLRERIRGPDDQVKISDATIGAVLDLATSALFHGDADTAKQHIRGLGKMIGLRGGLRGSAINSGFLMEILRCDMSIALITRTDPVFCCETADTMHKHPSQMITDFDGSENPDFFDLLDPYLADVWLIARNFCLLVNLAAQTKRQIDPTTIYETMTSTMYPLLHMSFASGSWDESVRLGVLVYAQHVFLQGQEIRLPWNPLSREYRIQLQSWLPEAVIRKTPSQIVLWLLMVGAISLFTVSEEEWLGDALKSWIEKYQARSWKDLQQALKSCMWIPMLDERTGQQIYDSIVTVG